MTNRVVSLLRALALSVALIMLTPSFAVAQTSTSSAPVGATAQAAGSPDTGLLRQSIAEATRPVEAAPAQTSGKPQKKWFPGHKVVIIILIVVAVFVGAQVVHTV